MRLLVSALFLLFLAGTYGAAIGKENEEQSPPPAKPTLRDALKTLLHDGLMFGVDLVTNWDSSEDDRMAALSNRMDLLKKDYINLAYSSSLHMVEIVKEVYTEFNATYPVYNNKVAPLLAAVALHAVNDVKQLVEEIKPTFEKFEEQMKVHQNAFWETVLPIVKKKTKPVIDALNSSLKPYIEEVRKEVQNAKEGKDDRKGSPEQDALIRNMDEYYNIAERVQKVFLFDKDEWKKLLSQMEIFNANS
ncbi:uncharacterized protein ACNLHF_001559 isoform 1-T2 [Anomaloglossus baeobatrachus]|uniref:uncharacterized protein LOC142256629 n=1 Tax=Anomaloglossus baeobatrachus TaxID=238106 RepID=UPI003F502C10